MLLDRADVPTVDLGGVRFLSVTEERCVQLILDESEAGRGGWVITPNLDILRQCVKEPRTRDLVARADVLVADGMPLIWASRLQGTPLPERVSGSHIISSLSAGAAGRRRSLYLLGGAPGTAERARDVLRDRHPELEIRGTYCPEYGFEKDPAQVAAIRDAVGQAGADIVFVALSFPKGEHLIESIRDVLPATWWVGVGISFSFLCGDVRRAPEWMQRTGLEWIHRLSQEPKRLARRYLVDDLPFAGELFVSAAARRLLR